MYDLVTGIYSIRPMKLSVGQSFNVSLSDSGLVYEVPVRITKRERQKTIFGKVWCWRPRGAGPKPRCMMPGSWSL